MAAEVINRHIATETSRSILFLVPSVELVAQQAEVIEKWCFPNDSSRVSIHHGGVKAPASLPSKSVLVSTADAFMNLQDCKPRHFGWDSFSLCVIDEVHHTIKDHPYRKISLKLSSFRNSTVLMDEEKTSDVDNIQVLCLSASLTYKVSENDIEKAINKLCAELCIQKMESPSHGELIEGGYVPPKDDCIEIETSQEVPAGVVPKYRRKNHDMYGTFMKRIDQRKATEFSLMVHQVVKTLEHMMQAAYSTFKSPLSNCKLKAWEEAAHDKANDYPFHCLPKLLESWYVALRILAQTWEEDEEIVLQWLSCRDAFNVESLDDALLTELVEAVKAHRQTISEHLKVFRLLKHLIDKKERYGDEFRCIVFVQQQITAYVLGEHFINNRCNSNTESESGIKSAYVVSRGSKVTPSIKFNKTMAEKTIEKFRSGEINVLVATSVIEEVSVYIFCCLCKSVLLYFSCL